MQFVWYFFYFETVWQIGLKVVLLAHLTLCAQVNYCDWSLSSMSCVDINTLDYLVRNQIVIQQLYSTMSQRNDYLCENPNHKIKIDDIFEEVWYFTWKCVKVKVVHKMGLQKPYAVCKISVKSRDFWHL